VKGLYKFFIFSLIISVSMMDAFAVSDWLRLPVMLSMIVLLIESIKAVSKTFEKQRFSRNDLYLLAFLVTLILSILANPNFKSVNYFLSYSFVILVWVIMMRSFLKGFNLFQFSKKINALAVILVSLFVVLDFFTFFLGITDLQQMFPRINEPTALFAGSQYRRSYGFTTEPAMLAMYFNTLGLLAIADIWKWSIQTFTKLCLTGLIVLAYITTFSSAAFVSILLAAIIVAFLRSLIIKSVSRRLLIGMFSAAIILLALSRIEYFDFFTSNIVAKLDLSDGSLTSVQVRTSRWTEAVTLLSSKPFFGHGLGFYSAAGEYSPNSWFLMLAVECGILAPMFLFLYFGGIVMDSLRINDFRFYSVGILAAVLHFFVISTFFHPSLWILISLYSIERKKIYDTHRRLKFSS